VEIFNNIPLELRALRQWIVWRYEATRIEDKPTKVPYDAKGGRYARTTEPQTWASFNEAVAALQTGQFNGIGFVFTTEDNYCGIDLDNVRDPQIYERMRYIHDQFNTYSEWSPSGNGIHLICKGHVVSGRRRAGVEIYSTGRYFTMTGNVINNVAIAERQRYVEILWGELGKGEEARENFYTGDLEPKEEDAAIFERAKSAANGDKFLKLWNGDWATVIDEHTGGPMPSQSEADQALINILAFYTQNRQQIRNMFAASALGKRDKAKRVDYLERNINKAFDRLIPQVDLETLKNDIEEKKARADAARAMMLASGGGAQAAVTAVQAAGMSIPMNGVHVNLGPTGIVFPPGLVGEIAEYIFQNSPRPVAEIALMGSLGFMAGICGRTYNVSGTGLNMYLLMLAKTGRGKDALKIATDRLLAEMANKNMPAALNFRGPTSLQSGQALVNELSTHPCFVSIIGEFDKFMSELTSRNAASSTVFLKKLLLELYSLSGEKSAYAGASWADKKKNIKYILSPSFSILGEGTPDRFYQLLDMDMIADGFLPRFFILEYHGIRVEKSDKYIAASPQLMNRLASLLQTVLIDMQTATLNHRGVIGVQLDPTSQKMGDEFSQYCDIQINQASVSAVAELWNRAHLKVLKLAALVAVGMDITRPVITADALLWAIRLIERDINAMTTKFDEGAIGSSDAKQISELRRVLREYLDPTIPFERWGNYGGDRKLHQNKIIPYNIIQRRLASTASFANDRLGATNALNRALSTIQTTGEIVQINPEQIKKDYHYSGRCYMAKELDL
jgi:hypothetical protein